MDQQRPLRKPRAVRSRIQHRNRPPWPRRHRQDRARRGPRLAGRHHRPTQGRSRQRLRPPGHHRGQAARRARDKGRHSRPQTRTPRNPQPPSGIDQEHPRGRLLLPAGHQGFSDRRRQRGRQTTASLHLERRALRGTQPRADPRRPADRRGAARPRGLPQLWNLAGRQPRRRLRELPQHQHRGATAPHLGLGRDPAIHQQHRLRDRLHPQRTQDPAARRVAVHLVRPQRTLLAWSHRVPHGGPRRARSDRRRDPHRPRTRQLPEDRLRVRHPGLEDGRPTAARCRSTPTQGSTRARLPHEHLAPGSTRQRLPTQRPRQEVPDPRQRRRPHPRQDPQVGRAVPQGRPRLPNRRHVVHRRRTARQPTRAHSTSARSRPRHPDQEGAAA